MGYDKEDISLPGDSETGKLRRELREARDLNAFFGRALETLENLIAEYNREEDAFSRFNPSLNDSNSLENVATRMLKALEDTRARFAYIERKLSFASDNARNLEIENRRVREELDSALEDGRAAGELIKNLQEEYASLQQTLISTKRRLAEKEAPFADRVHKHLANRRGLKRFFYLPAAIGKAVSAPPELPVDYKETIGRILEKGEFANAEQYVRSIAISPESLALGLQIIALDARIKEPVLSLKLLREASSLDPSPKRTALHAFQQFYMGNISAAHALMSQLLDKSSLTENQLRTSVRIAVMKRYLNQTPSLPQTPKKKLYESRDDTPLFVMDSFPARFGDVSGARSYELLKSLRNAGINVALAAPGVPANDAKASFACESLNLPQKLPSRLWFEKNSEQIVAKASNFKATAIHCCASYDLAISALMAARRLGIPFIYDIRGFWEYDCPANLTQYTHSELFRVKSRFNLFLARNADLIICWRSAIADKLIQKGINASRVQRLPQNIRAMECPWPLNVNREGFDALHPGLPSESVFQRVLASAEYLRKRNPRSTLTFLSDSRKFSRTILPDYVKIRKSSDYDGAGDLKEHFSAVIFSGEGTASDKFLGARNFFEFPGLPIIVSDSLLPAPPLESGKNCLSYPAGNALALADAMEMLAKNPALSANLAIAALNDSAPDWETVSARLIDLYNTLGIATTLSERGYHKRWEANEPYSDYNIALVKERGLPSSAPRLPVPIAAGGAPIGSHEKKLLREEMLELAKIGDDQLRKYIRAHCVARPRATLAWCVETAAGALINADRHEDAIRLVRDLLHDHKGALNLRAGAKVFYNAMDFPKALALIRKYRKEKEELSESDKKFCAEVENCYSLINQASQIKTKTINPEPKRILNPLAFSLPWSSVGYATRSHGIARAIKSAGWDILPYTRPGFPADSKPEYMDLTFPESDTVDDLVYGRVFDFNRKQFNEVQYLYKSADAWEKIIRERSPALVHAASNYAVAFPALVAARRSGIPFIYEMRGFWEITRSSRDPDFIHTQKYRQMTYFERLTARLADHVITITTPMKNELISQGIAPDKISIAYNGVETEKFIPLPKDRELAARLGIPPDTTVIGYVGSIVDYEGLDDLLKACAALATEGLDFRLLVTGDGHVLESLKAMAENNGLGEKVIFTGRVPFEEVDNYYSLIDITPFPRKPWRICELVSPLKPMEAMAMEKAVIVSGTAALKEMATPETALVFEAGDNVDLARKLKILLKDTELRIKLGKAARRWVMENRSWKGAANVCANAYAEVLKA